MKEKREYAGIDYFRVIAAFLVITIYTSPLSSVNEIADFILTRVIARTVVPFFFMASGFFLLPGYISEKKTGPGKLPAFLKKTAILYGIASLMYLPVNIYAGYFKSPHLLPNLLKDLVFDGTFYHLWYLPAVMLGAIITCFMLGRLKINHAFAIALGLYVIGLFGDSYYGIATKVPFLKSFYDAVFVLTDYTRNGLFFAPVFLMLGGLIAKYRKRRLKTCIIGFAVSSTLLMIEGLTLHGFQVQRHDSMYFMLLPCMVFLFQSLMFWEGRGGQILRNLSMMIYLIHPLIIVFIRGVAKVISLQRLLIDNSVVNFLAVALCSFIATMAIASALRRKNKKQPVLEQVCMDRAWAEIHLANLGHNVKVLRDMLPNGCELMAVVKANAYGHGDVEIACYLNRIGVASFAVATIEEGIRLRTHGIEGDILILGYTDPQRVPELVRYRLSQTVTEYKHAKQLNASKQQISVHIKIDTGMHRLGESCNNAAEIESIFQCHNLKVCGIYTHLCVADSTQEDDVAFTEEQLSHFYTLLEQLKQHQIALPKIHIQSSYGILNYPELQCSYARRGRRVGRCWN
ncbi:alanine racemase [Desulfoscipio gibsoniae]|uniref:Alanine racemase n=1 Tax=Desulfoscipio gibsoniae DSM 7213 TaxID=767817 RepID=R4KDE2_9FIRM|nr:alanine racemase [Desulfoscipio gibsoniae]AGL01208.1 alanine racemase [Desulfoscipio gibsoniae DSM 7213]